MARPVNNLTDLSSADRKLKKKKSFIHRHRKRGVSMQSQSTCPKIDTRVQSEMVTNLSDHVLTEDQNRLISKGLTFVPDRKSTDVSRVLADLAEWERRMRLREFFFGQERKEEKPEEKFTEKKKSDFTPEKGRDTWLDMYTEVVKSDIIAGLKRAKTLNLSKQENTAMHELLHNDKIVIRPADKGSGIVIVNKEDYTSKLQEEMTNSDSYQETERNRADSALKEVKKLVNRMYKQGAISKDMQEYLIPRYPRAGELKGNPKLHKQGAPMRTIVNGINTATERIAEVAEYELNEFVKSSPSHIQDTTGFLKKLSKVQQPLPEGTILFCFDVKKLYPSVPKEEGIQACKEGLKMRTDPLVPTETVVDMIKAVLEHTVFSFDNTNYIQTEGIAIGSRLGKNFACSHMRKWDEELENFEKQPLFYKRFIDDGFRL